MILKFMLFIGVTLLSISTLAQTSSEEHTGKNVVLVAEKDIEELEFIAEEEGIHDSLIGLTFYGALGGGSHLPAQIWLPSLAGGVGIRVDAAEIGIEGDTGKLLNGASSVGVYVSARPFKGLFRRVYIKGRAYRVFDLPYDHDWTNFDFEQGPFHAFEFGAGVDFYKIRVEATIGDIWGEEKVKLTNNERYQPFRVIVGFQHGSFQR